MIPVWLFRLLLIAGGGAAGAVCRYLLAGWTQRLVSGSFPAGTMAVNILGCFAIGFLGMALTGPVLVREEYRLALLMGFLGGFTTFSSFGWETFMLANEGQRGSAAANLLVMNAIGLLAVWAGYRLAEWLYGV